MEINKVKKIKNKKIFGLQKIDLKKIKDNRGWINKIFNKKLLEKIKIHKLGEIYYSVSKKNVFRGFHIQLKPYENTKVIHCIDGKIIDYTLDLRKDSKTFLLLNKFYLDNNSILLIPKGVAHAYYTINDSTLIYYSDIEYNEKNNISINWKSVDNNLISKKNIVISKKDINSISLNKYLNEK